MDSIVILFIAGLFGLFAGMRQKPLLSISIASLGLIGAALAAYFRGSYHSPLAHYAAYVPTPGLIILLLCGATLLAILGGYARYRSDAEHTGDYLALILFSLCGAILMAQPNDLMLFFIGLEILSIPIYVLVGIEKGSSRSAEAAVKYFFTGSFASAILLFGIALLYGATGSFQLIEIQSNLAIGIWQSPMAIIGSLFILAGFTFKIGAVPFHFWGPDVYDGASNAVLMYMATVVKIAGIYALINVFGQVFRDSYSFWIDLISLIIVLSMFYGYITAWKQTSFRRLIAYSSIANAGLMLFALVDTYNSNIFFFVAAYASATIALVVINLAVKDESDSLSTWEGIAWKNPLIGIALVLALFSLAGIPPFAGFFGKYFLFWSAVPHTPNTAILALIASVVGAFVYLRLLLSALKKPEQRVQIHLSVEQILVLILTTAFSIGAIFMV
ncbi:MAG: NADH-quinone oxidoreductase subunit N [Flavobacteriales bacterium]